MSLLTTEIPSAEHAPDRAAPSAVTRELRRQTTTRRTVLRLMVGTGMAIGVSAVGLLPGARKAQAGWWSTYASHSDCAGYYNSSTTCYPPEWYITNAVCNGAGYHRDDGGSGTCYNFRHTVKLTACNQRNAWHWSGNRTRCSDGYYEYNTCQPSHWFTSSICRAGY